MSQILCHYIKRIKALVRSHLDYASCIWSAHKQKYKDEIENVQRRVTKQINRLKDLLYHERLKRLNLPNLAYRRIRRDMIKMYKLLHNRYDIDTSKCIKLHR